MPADRFGENWRNLIMTEITRQLGPLEDKIDRASHAIERLFNTNGGPPGYLQTARAEDEKRFGMIFNILDEHKKDFRSIKDFVQRHQFQEERSAEEKKESEKAFNRKMAKWMLAVTLLIGILELIAHNLGPIMKTVFDPPVPHSQLQSTVPNWRQ